MKTLDNMTVEESINSLFSIADFFNEYLFIFSLSKEKSKKVESEAEAEAEEKRDFILIKYMFKNYDDIDDDLDFDEFHYEKICHEFERLMEIYIKDIIKSQQFDVCVQNFKKVINSDILNFTKKFEFCEEGKCLFHHSFQMSI